VSVSIRSAFVAGDDMVLVGADYSQLEMRLLAHVAEDKTLEMFFSSGKDVHSQVASHWKKKPVDQVLPQEREYAKRLVYGIMYGTRLHCFFSFFPSNAHLVFVGMGAKALADHLNVSQQEARKFMNEFMSSYPAVKKWIDKTIGEAKKNHQVRTLYGRRRVLVADGDDASRADRQAVNSIVQGTAADIVKRTFMPLDVLTTTNLLLCCAEAMLSIDDAVRGTPTRLLLQIHDELIYECHQSDARRVLGIIKDRMEQVVSLRVPLPVSLKMGKSWASLEAVKLDDPTAFDAASQASQLALPAVNEYAPIGGEVDDEIDDIFSDF
jgi:DNA polymerase I-like protein with 3'-5' exonuclease and polymerase domains